jgi:hypothetical protein
MYETEIEGSAWGCSSQNRKSFIIMIGSHNSDKCARQVVGMEHGRGVNLGYSNRLVGIKVLEGLVLGDCSDQSRVKISFLQRLSERVYPFRLVKIQGHEAADSGGYEIQVD